MEYKIRKARMQDAEQINKLVDYYARQGFMLARPVPYIIPRIREFFVCTIEKNDIIGCVGLKIFNSKDWSEIFALAVCPEYKGNKIGQELISSCIDEAKTIGIKYVLMLTFQHELAEKMGFKKIYNINILPEIILAEKTVDVDKAYLLENESFRS